MAPGTLTEFEQSVNRRDALARGDRPMVDVDFPSWPADVWPRADASIMPCAWSYWGCSLLTALQEDAISRLDEIAACWRSGAVRTVRNGPDGFAPAWVTLDYPDGIMVVIQGTTNWMQMVAYVLGGLLSTPSGFLGKVNSHFYDTSRSIFQQMRAFYPQTSKPWTFCGHSYGAAVASVLASLCSKTGQATGGAWLFGGPMVGSGEWYSSQEPSQIRWANVSDPICDLPPERGAFGIITAAASLLSGSVEEYTHYGYSATLAPDGTMALVLNPTGLAGALDFVFHLPSGIVTGMDNHYIREYLNRLFKAPALRATGQLSRGFANFGRIHTLNGLG